MTFRKSSTLLTALLLFLCPLFSCVSVADGYGRLNLPEDLKRIESGAFTNVLASTVVFPDGIEYIAPDAFSGVINGIGIGSADNTVAEEWCVARGWTYQAYTRCFALIIANNDYWYLNDLPGVYQDGTTLEKALKAYGWNVKLVRSRTAYQMQSDIISYFSETRDTDVCMVYYSGHGDDGTGSSAGGLCGVDWYYGSGELLPGTLRDVLLSSTKGHVIVVLDSCGSGATVYDRESSDGGKKDSSRNFVNGVMNAFGSYLKKNSYSKTGELLNRRFSVLAACEYGETSNDGYITQDSVNKFFEYYDRYGKVDWNRLYKRGGTFTYSFVRSLGCSYPAGAFSGTMTADSNNDQVLTLGEMYYGVKKQVANMNEMWEKALWEHGIIDSEPLFDQEVQVGGVDGKILFMK